MAGQATDALLALLLSALQVLSTLRRVGLTLFTVYL